MSQHLSVQGGGNHLLVLDLVILLVLAEVSTSVGGPGSTTDIRAEEYSHCCKGQSYLSHLS